ncbi:D-alanyl-D-alanine carboxypeptidase [Agrobacterium sp. a22-2]|uniref:D-alanyl-D-alanine carboxypeptidase n=1 Tax=Agrobacterium sp. a22-2 TaxID=2283840 RepID=UPI0014452A4C|nr:D-alanyl-D-alanine carboxypeptidase [Agrobacterium sp. a22-2]NKN39435.1 D-alanyl-D-alanine carboxypeptidase [Agrobacterium sp. a22-2]
MHKLLIAFTFFVAIACLPQGVSAGQANFLLDARTGRVLASENADTANHPASLTKMMTLYMTFDAIRRGKLSWDTPVRFSKLASSRPPTKLWVKAGDSITVRDAVMGMIVVSANDAATAIAEKLGGTESEFGAMMTAKARSLGMTRTVLVNASGLPDKRQITTARDMATLGVVLLRDFPEEYKLFSAESFTFRGRKIRGHNNLMYGYKGMDGIKTGYTDWSGFNLVSAVRDGDRRVIGVVLGGRTAASRDKTMKTLLDRNIANASGGRQLVASLSSGAQVAALGDDVPVPLAAPRPGEALAAVTSMAKGTPIPNSRYENAFAESVSVPEVELAPAAGRVEAPVPPRAMAVAAAPAARTEGWQIQIAAAQSRQAAIDMLARAKQQIGGPLAGRDTYTQEVTRDGQTLYRARFVGFSSKTDARAACDRLVKKSYDCLLMPSQG